MSRYSRLWACAHKPAVGAMERPDTGVQARAHDVLSRMPTYQEFCARGASKEAREEFFRLRGELEGAVRDPGARVRFGGRRR